MRTYKLFRIDVKGHLFPLYVNANKEIPVGVWLKAEEGELAKDGKHVKSKLGPLSYRPGWHSGEYPVATHIGEKADKGDSKPSYRPSWQVWAECEVHTDVDYTCQAGRWGLKRLPVHGGYWFKTNANMTGAWFISGEIRVNRILSDKEVADINAKFGVSDLPRRK